MVFRTNEGAQARGLLAARTKYSRSKAQHIRELCHKDVRNTAILGNYAIKSMKMSRIKGGLGEIQRFFCLLEQKNFRTTRPFCTSKKYIGAQKPQRKPAFPSFSSFYSLFEFYKSALKFAWPQLFCIWIGPIGIMRVNINIALRKMTPSHPAQSDFLRKIHKNAASFD